jgi:hypothetical protein
MSTQANRSLAGPGTVVEFPPSFVTRLTEAGFNVPDQDRMLQMKRATAIGLPWTASDHEIDVIERKTVVIVPFTIFSLDEYAQVRDNEMGAPMPESVGEHIRDVMRHFPGAEVRIHAHPKDDPFVEFVLDGQSVFTKAWLRNYIHGVQIYPKYVMSRS